MKKTALFILLLLMACSFSSCDWFRARLGMPTSEQLAEAKDKAVRESMEKAAQLQTQERQHQTNDSLAVIASQKTQRITKNYHVIFGSFMDQRNADKMVEKLTGQGLAPMELQFNNGFSAVSAASYGSLTEAYTGMNHLLNTIPFCPYDVWIYDLKQGLHKDF